MAKKTKHPKLPNGFGSIKKLSGNRSNPYAVYPPTTEFTLTGAPVAQPALCYVPDWNTGFYALMEYNNGTFDLEKFQSPKVKDSDADNVIIQKIIAAYNNQNRNTVIEKTFAEVYQEFYAYKYERDKTREYSRSATGATKSAYKNSSALHQRPFRELKTDDLQSVIDNCPKKHATKEHIVNLFRQMYDYADANDLCDKKYSDYVKINTPDDDELGVPFTAEEIAKIWEASENNTVMQGILIMIYSGYRIAAYRKIEINFEEQYFKGGVKTRAGKERIVPFSPLIIPFINSNTELFTMTGTAYRELFKAELAKIGISDHTPHDCRHTFSWLCDVFKVDTLSKRMLLGHSLGKDVTDSKYGHRTIEELRTEISKIDRNIPCC